MNHLLLKQTSFYIRVFLRVCGLLGERLQYLDLVQSWKFEGVDVEVKEIVYLKLSYCKTVK